MASHAYFPSIWEAEAGGLQIQDQPGLHSKSLSQKAKSINKVKSIGIILNNVKNLNSDYKISVVCCFNDFASSTDEI
jgi:hypothetical protein